VGMRVVQPALYVDAQENVRMLLRTDPHAKYMATAASDKGGLQWSAPAVLTSVPNPNSALDALRLADGRLLLVYNHSFKPGAVAWGQAGRVGCGVPGLRSRIER